jgi:hypothetical protein
MSYAEEGRDAAVRETIGSLLQTMAAGVVKHAAEVAEETHGRLADVSREDTNAVLEQPLETEQWPRLFSNLRDGLRQIDGYLDSIQRDVRRVEV